MTDEEIIELYFAREDAAIQETDAKYGKLVRHIARGVLRDTRDREEAMQDSYMVLWNTIPPRRPNPLGAYLCRTVKNLCLKKYAYMNAEKRKNEYAVSLDELSECIPAASRVEDAVLTEELQDRVNLFLRELPKEKRGMFLRRYYFLDSVKEIAKEFRISEKAASMRLCRIREELGRALAKEGFLNE